MTRPLLLAATLVCLAGCGQTKSEDAAGAAPAVAPTERPATGDDEPRVTERGAIEVRPDAASPRPRAPTNVCNEAHNEQAPAAPPSPVPRGIVTLTPAALSRANPLWATRLRASVLRCYHPSLDADPTLRAELGISRDQGGAWHVTAPAGLSSLLVECVERAVREVGASSQGPPGAIEGRLRLSPSPTKTPADGG